MWGRPGRLSIFQFDRLFFDFFLSKFDMSIIFLINYSAKKSSQLFSRLFFGQNLTCQLFIQNKSETIISSIIQQKSLVNYLFNYFFDFFRLFYQLFRKKSSQLFSQLFLGQNWTCQLFFNYFIN